MKETERQKAINKEIKELEEKIDELNTEYEDENLKAANKERAEGRRERFLAYCKAGFSEDEAYDLMCKDYYD